MDDEEFEPDEEFYCELYDQKTGFSLKGKDAKCTILIVDDDKPGTICFEITAMKILSSENWVTVSVIR